MTFKTKGIVIKEQSVGESDRIVTVLTAKEGVIKAFARRAKKYNDSKISSTALLCYSDFKIYKGKEKYIIENARPIESYFSVREDLDSLSLAQYFCEISALLIPHETESEEFLRLVLNSMSMLKNKDKLLIKAITELRMMSLSGYMPNLVACSECGMYEHENWYFNVHNGEIICGECYEEENVYSFNIKQNIVNAMRYIVFSDFNKIYSFSMSKQSINMLAKVVETYALNVLDKTPKTLEFFKNINEDYYG